MQLFLKFSAGVPKSATMPVWEIREKAGLTMSNVLQVLGALGRVERGCVAHAFACEDWVQASRTRLKPSQTNACATAR
jgi:hypothetical protein